MAWSKNFDAFPCKKVSLKMKDGEGKLTISVYPDQQLTTQEAEVLIASLREWIGGMKPAGPKRELAYDVT